MTSTALAPTVPGTVLRTIFSNVTVGMLMARLGLNCSVVPSASWLTENSKASAKAGRKTCRRTMERRERCVDRISAATAGSRRRSAIRERTAATGRASELIVPDLVRVSAGAGRGHDLVEKLRVGRGGEGPRGLGCAIAAADDGAAIAVTPELEVDREARAMIGTARPSDRRADACLPGGIAHAGTDQIDLRGERPITRGDDDGIAARVRVGRGPGQAVDHGLRGAMAASDEAGNGGDPAGEGSVHHAGRRCRPGAVAHRAAAFDG